MHRPPWMHETSPRAPRSRWACLLSLLASLLALQALVGCDATPQNPAAPSGAGADATDSPTVGGDTAAAGQRETEWGLIHFAGQRVGYSKSDSQITNDGHEIRRATSEMHVSVLQHGQPISQTIHYEWTEIDGLLSEFEYRLAIGAVPQVTRGKVGPDGLATTVRVGFQSKSRTVPAPKELRGFDPLEESLRRRMMTPGESREFDLLQMGLAGSEFGHLRAVAVDWQETPLLAESRRLLRIDATLTIDGRSQEMQVHCDEQGRVWKSVAANGNQIVYRATQEEALQQAGAATFDLAAHSIVKARLDVADPHALTEAVYRVRLAQKDPLEVFATGLSQELRPIDDRTAEMTVRAVRPAHPPLDTQQPVDREPTAADREPNPLVQSDDDVVVALAQSIVPDERDPWTVAVALEQLVRSKMRNRGPRHAFASAAEVARSFEGDCTEYGVLLAALLRARGIPSRVALGLVYHGPSGGFAYHLWTEAWIADRWVPLDATLARGGIGAAHIKISDTALRDANTSSAFLPVLDAMGQMQLTVVRTQ